MDQRASDVFWLQKLIELKKKGKEDIPTRSEATPHVSPPMVGLDDGVRSGYVNWDLKTGMARDEATVEEMRKQGFDSDVGYMEQMRFQKPEFFAAFNDLITTARTTGRSCFCVVMETEPMPTLCYVGLSPTADGKGFNWTAVRLPKFMSALIHNNEEIIEHMNEQTQFLMFSE